MAPLALPRKERKEQPSTPTSAKAPEAVGLLPPRQSLQQGRQWPHFIARETETPGFEVQLFTRPGIPLEPRAGRAQLRRESQAEGEGRNGTGKGFPSPTPQHLPPLSTPPHRPGYESKTNRALGLRMGGEVPKKEIKRQRVERELRAARRRRGPSGRGQRTLRRGDRSGGAEGRDAGARLWQSGAWRPGPACAPSPGPTWLRQIGRAHV